MKRGEVWTAAGGGDYAGKPRPVVILQDDRFDANDSVTICGFTTELVDAPLVRIAVAPSSLNGLDEPCQAMIDKITTVQRRRLRAQIGRLDEPDMIRVTQAILVFLGYG